MNATLDDCGGFQKKLGAVPVSLCDLERSSDRMARVDFQKFSFFTVPSGSEKKKWLQIPYI